MPDLDALVETVLGAPYSQYDCWNLVRHLYAEGFGVDLARDAEQAATVFQEVWYRGDPSDPLTLVQPWDLVIVANDASLAVSNGVGVVLNVQQCLCSSKALKTVARVRLRLLRHSLLQLARYRELL